MNQPQLAALLRQNVRISENGRFMAKNDDVVITKTEQDYTIEIDSTQTFSLSAPELDYLFSKRFQGPLCPSYFVGRQEELNQLRHDLKPAHLVTLCGPGGIGKTALLAQAVSELTSNESLLEQFPDGMVYYDFAEEPRVSEILSDLARTFGDDPERGLVATAAQRALAGRQALLVLDSAEEADQLSELLAVRGGCTVLMTSRQRKDAQAKRIDLLPLALPEAITLLERYSKPHQFERQSAQTICQLVGRWPFALCLLGCRLEQEQEGLNDYLKRLQQNILGTLHQGEGRADSVARFLSQSFRQVSQQAQSVLAIVGMLANAPFKREVVAHLLDMPTYAIGALLGELVNYGLLVRQKRDYEVTHRLIHTHAETYFLLLTQEDNNLIERFIDYYFEFVKANTSPSVPLAEALIKKEHPHIIKALQRLKESDQPNEKIARERLIDFVEAMTTYWDAQDEDQLDFEWLIEAYRCASELNQPLTQGKMASRLGQLIAKQRESTTLTHWIEHVQSNLTTQPQLETNIILALMYIHRAFILLSQGEFKQALADFRHFFNMKEARRAAHQPVVQYHQREKRTLTYDKAARTLDYTNWDEQLWQEAEAQSKLLFGKELMGNIRKNITEPHKAYSFLYQGHAQIIYRSLALLENA